MIDGDDRGSEGFGDEDLPLFNKLDDLNAKAIEDTPRRSQKLLEILKSHDEVSLNDLQHEYGFQVTRGRHEKMWLCKRGHIIESSHGIYRYIGKKEDLVETPKNWQDDYYKCEHWKSKRLERLEMDNSMCQQCKAMRSVEAPLHVHHWRYRLFAEDVRHDLETLCRNCHDVITKSPNICIPFPKFLDEDTIWKLWPDWPRVDTLN